MKFVTVSFSIFVFMVLSFFGVSAAMAQQEGLAELAKPVLDAVLSGSYAYAAALALVLGVALLRRYGGAKWPLLASKKAAPYLVLVGSFGAALATSLSAGAGITLAMTWGALKVAAGAGYGYAVLKPIFMGLQKRAPGWMSPVFDVVGWVFETRTKAAEARIAKAIDAGVVAVESNPSAGLPTTFKDVE